MSLARLALPGILQQQGAGGGGGGPGTDWNTYVASLSPWAWWKLDDGPTVTTATDSSGNARHGTYPNGTFAGYPDREEPPLISDSTYSLVSGGGGNVELGGNDPFGVNLFGGGGSWTFGAIYETTVTTSANNWIRPRSSGTLPLAVGFNYDKQAGTTVSGTLSLQFDTTGTTANTLVASSTGWNDGSPHLLMFEYDSTADTLSIWVDGTEAATRSRAGTKPGTSAFSGVSFDVMSSTGSPTGVGIDEFLFFDRVLTSTEHSNLASYL